MATAQLATFELGGTLFGVPVERVQEVLRSQPRTPVPLAPPAVDGLLNLRGQVVTALDLRTRLCLPDPAETGPGGESGEPMNVVVRAADEVVSLLVDVIGEVVDVSDDAFEPPPATLVGPARELVHGAYKLDGRLLLALDIDRVVDI
ncbi:MAG TPA: chemotaxis protein CheW [Actinomycetes bacterium]|nr:chemotaxis protein CheW [Actinomycetes bacterium]